VLTAIVADDFEQARQLFVSALDSSGRYRVVAGATNGHEAVSAVEAHRPDLAVLDLAMPVAGGLDVIEEMNEISPSTRVVVVSGFPGRDLENLVLARGAAGYVRKQPSIRTVIEQIHLAAGLLDLAGEVLTATRTFPPDLTSAGQARRFLDEIVERWNCQPALDVLRLLISEVVANAVVHARSEPTVSVRLLGPSIRIEVSDDSDLIAEPGDADTESEGGRGLAIVASQASAWGVSPRPEGGKTVWFEMPSFEEP
jgi:CheY-like chemotaxis protein